ncbi:MAG: hypothetical protein IKQ56_06115 [Lachnospiraceae bacterium]|nr:hypothetical protein [Lachnospiraceae bacterium]MCR4947395.1 DUF6465 family protein [Lachnospiraceae bacterium]
MARKSSTERAQQLVGGFATAKKKVVIQYGGIERKESEIMERIREDIEKKGVPDADITEVDVYIKPEDRSVYYVVNEDVNGSVFF